MALIISEQVTKKLIDMPQALAVVEKVFRDYAANRVRRLRRYRLKGKQKGLNIMAAWHADWDLFCMRYYTGKLTSSISLHSGRTGQFLALMNASYIAPLRTGATSGVAAKYLAPPRARVLGVIGPGRQATFQTEAIALSTPVQTVLVYGRNQARRKKFIREMQKTIRAELKESSSLEEIEARSDIIVLSTISPVPILDGSHLKDEALVISIGANQVVKHEVSGSLIRLMDLIVTDDIPTAQNDAGDLISAHDEGILHWEEVVPLDRFVGGGKPDDRPKRILFQSNGVADDTLAVGHYVLGVIRRRRVKVRKIPEI
jgi:ornithine cyclodeaminase